MLFIEGNKGQLINLDRVVVIDAVFNDESKKWEVQAYFSETFCDVIRAYEIEDHARQCVNELWAQISPKRSMEFNPCISETLVKVPSSK